MPEQKKPVVINRKFSGIASKYVMHVTHLYIDEHAVRVEYQITPPLPPTTNSELPGIPILTWWGYARDDHGGDYQSAGGASGLSPDGKYTDGVLSFLPLPNEEVKRLDITMISILRGTDTETKCEFSVIF